MGKKRILLSWSSGKDSAWALHELRQDPTLQVCGLITAVNATHGRVAMHAVRERLLVSQANSVGLPLRTIPIPHPCSNEEYEAALGRELQRAVSEDIAGIAFGDLFLKDVRDYRERQVQAFGLGALFPLWGRDTTGLAAEMIRSGLRARLTCIDPRRCSAHLVGREFDNALLRALPNDVDPCGENGEFHTFAYAGPMFAQPVRVTTGRTTEREGFVFADLVPG